MIPPPLTHPPLAGPAEITAARLQVFAPHSNYVAIAPLLDKEALRVGITTPARVACWLGQLHVESAGFTRLVESLAYSAERLCELWPHRFPSIAHAEACLASPGKVAEAMYGGNAGLGNTQPGDGARFIGRGWIQRTGRANYAQAARELGVDLLARPELLAGPALASADAANFWRDHGCNALADAGQVDAISRKINGGDNGLDDRRHRTALARTIWR